MLLLFVATILLATTCLAFYDATVGCSVQSNCEAVKSNSTRSDLSDDAEISAPLQVEYLYAIVDDFNASFPVIEYHEVDFPMDTHLSDSELLPWLLHRDSIHQQKQYEHYFVLVQYYKPYCQACLSIKDVYIKLASFLRLVFLEASSRVDKPNNSFQAYAINCVRYSHLCSTVQSYPSIQIYNMNEGSVVDLSRNFLHPHSVLRKLEFDEHTTHSIIHKIAKEMKIQSGATTIKSSYDFNDDHLKDLTQQLEYMYNERKQVDLEQDLLATVDTMFRRYVYVPKNINMTTTRNARDPPLKSSSAHSLGVLLDLVIRIIPPFNPYLERFHNMVKELASNYIYVTNHKGYLPVILDEFRISVPVSSNSRKNRRSRYSQDCSPRKPIILPNDDELLTVNAESSGVEDDFSYRCGIWKFLFHMIVGGGLTIYNDVALRKDDRISNSDWIKILRDYATNVGFGTWSAHDIRTLNSTRLCNESVNSNESPEMQLALWLGVVRNEMQVYQKFQTSSQELHSNELHIQEADVLSVQWPLREDCPSCWTDVSRSLEGVSRQKMDCLHDRPVHWNDEIVYKYIKLEYGSPPDTMEELLQLYFDVYPDEYLNKIQTDIEHSDEL